jgi:hypothetical protein
MRIRGPLSKHPAHYAAWERLFAASYQLYARRSIRFSQAPELGGRKIRSGAKSAGQSTVIVKAAIVGDVRDWSIGFDEQSGGGGEPRLHDKLVGSNPEDTLYQPSEADRRQARALGQRTGGNGIVAVRLEIFQRAGEAGWDALAIARRAQISGDADDANNDTVVIAHGKFRRQTPTRTSMGVPMQFQVIDYCAAGSDHRLILDGVKLCEFFWKDLLNMSPEQFLFVAATASFDQGLVDCDVAAASVFDKKCCVWNVVEELLDDGQFGGNARRHFRERTGKC